MKETKLNDEIVSRRLYARNISDWKDNYEWAIFWLSYFINTANDLEDILIKEVGVKKYNDIINKLLLDKGAEFFKTHIIPTSSTLSENNKHPDKHPDKYKNNIITFPSKL